LGSDWRGVPQDEYDDYVGPVLRLLIEGKPAAEIADYLRITAAETIACPVSEHKLAIVVDKLLDLRGERS
jgi:hypothetical protein